MSASTICNLSLSGGATQLMPEQIPGQGSQEGWYCHKRKHRHGYRGAGPAEGQVLTSSSTRKRTMRSRRTPPHGTGPSRRCTRSRGSGLRDGPFCAGTLVGPDDEPHAFLEAVEEVLADP